MPSDAKERRWRPLWHRVRGALSAAILGAAGIAVAGGAFLYLSNTPVPDWVLGNRFARQVAERYGLEYELESLRIGRGFAIEAIGVALRLGDSIVLADVRIDRIARGDGQVALSAIEARFPRFGDRTVVVDDLAIAGSTLTAGGIRVINSVGETAVEVASLGVPNSPQETIDLDGIRMASGRGTPGVTIARVAVTRPGLDRDAGVAVVDRVTVSDLAFTAPEAPDPAPDGETFAICESIPGILSAIEQQRQRTIESQGEIGALLSRLQDDLAGAIAWLIGGLAVLAFLSASGAGNLPARAGIAAGVAGIPLLVSLAVESGFGLVVWSVVAEAALAAALWWFVYRRSGHWYQKWEPVAAGVVGGTFVALAILASRLAAPLGLPEVPNLRLETLAVDGRAASPIMAAACGRPGEIAVGAFTATAENIEAEVVRFIEDGRAEIRVGSIAISGAAGTAGLAIAVTGPEGDPVLAVSGLAGRAANVRVASNVPESRIEDLALDVDLALDLESPAARTAIEQVGFPRDRAGALSEVRIGFSGAIRGPASAPPTIDSIPEPAAANRDVRVRAGIGLDLDACRIPLDAAVDLDLAGVRASGELRIRGNRVEVVGARTAADSPVRIGGAEATIAIGETVEVDALLAEVGFAVGLTDVSTTRSEWNIAFPAGCTPSGTQSAEVALEGVGVVSSDGLRVDVDHAGFTLDREMNGTDPRFEAAAELDRVAIAADGPDGERWLTTDVPRIRTAISGTSSGGSFPEEVAGTIDLALERFREDETADPILALDQPVEFRARLSEPELVVAEQHRVVTQSIDPRFDREIPIDFSLRFSPGENGLSGLGANVRSDWITLGSLPSLPPAFRLDRIPSLELATTGMLDDLPIGGSGPAALGWSGSLPRCPALPGLANPFRIDAAIGEAFDIGIYGEAGPDSPDRIRIEARPDELIVAVGESGFGLRTAAIERRIRNLSAPEGRIASVDMQVAVDGILPLDGEGTPLRLASDLRTGDGSFAAEATIDRGDVRLLDLSVARRGTNLSVGLADRFPLGRFWDALLPFLAPLDCNLEWLDPDLIVGGEVSVELADGTVGAIDAAIDVEPGSILIVDLDRAAGGQSGTGFAPGYLRRLEARVPGEETATVRVRVGSRDATGDRTLTADVALPLEFTGRGQDGRVQSGAVDITARIDGALATTTPERGTIVRRTGELVAAIRRHRQEASRVFGVGHGVAPRNVDARWEIALAEATLDFVGVSREPRGRFDDLDVDLSIDVPEASDPIDVRVAGDLSWALRAHEDHLVVEAGGSLGEAPRIDALPDCRWTIPTALRIAVTDALIPIGADTGPLWDAAFYERFWMTYPALFTGGGAPPLDCRRLRFGNVSIRDLVVDSLPPLAVGVGDSIQIHVPFSGDALFGQSRGTFDAALEWASDGADLAVATRIEADGIQTAAVGLASGDDHIPAVEDRIDVEFDARTNALRIGRAGLLGSGFPIMDMDLRVTRSDPRTGPLGEIQASTNLDTRLMNDILDRIVDSVEFARPPQALTYNGLDLELAVRNGIIQTDRPLVRLDDVRILPTTDVDVVTDVNVFWQRPGWTMPDYRLESLVRSIERFLEPPVVIGNHGDR